MNKENQVSKVFKYVNKSMVKFAIHWEHNMFLQKMVKFGKNQEKWDFFFYFGFLLNAYIICATQTYLYP